MGFFDKFKSSKSKASTKELGITFDRAAYEEDRSNMYGPTTISREKLKEETDRQLALRALEKSKKGGEEGGGDWRYKERLNYQKKKAVETEIAKIEARAEQKRKDLALAQEIAFQKEYGPSIFKFGGYEKGKARPAFMALAKVNQMRNWQQAQELKRLKAEAAASSYRNTAYTQQARMQQAQQQAQGPAPFGMGLSMGGISGFGSGMGSGMSLGPSQSDQQQPSGGGFNSSLSLPIVGGLGANPFEQQQEPPQQYQPQYVQQPTQGYGTNQRPGYGRPATYMRPQQPYRGVNVPPVPVEYEQSGQISIFRKTMMPYGPKFTKIQPEEVQPGEPIYRRIQEKYGHKFIKIN